VPPQDADFRGVGVSLLETISEPVRHRIAEHHDRHLRDRIGLLGHGRLGIVRSAFLPLGWGEPSAAAAIIPEKRKQIFEQLGPGRRRRDHQQRRHRGHFRGDQDDGH